MFFGGMHAGTGPGFHFSSQRIDLNDLLGGMMGGAAMNGRTRRQ